MWSQKMHWKLHCKRSGRNFQCKTKIPPYNMDVTKNNCYKIKTEEVTKKLQKDAKGGK